MSAQRTVSREVQARVVEDLARGHRPVSAIADRHHVPVDLVIRLRGAFGPGLPELSEAAKRLRKPVAPPAAPAEIAALVAEVCPPAKDPKPYRDGLTGDERAKCRAWAESRGLLDPAKHSGVMLRRAVVESWRAEDCPDVSARTLEPVPGAEATPDDVIDAPIVCGTCGEPLPEPWGDSCPACGELFAPAPAVATPEQVKTTEKGEQPAAPWHDWSALMERAEGVPAVVREWDMAIQHVEMLRDALAEHEHREGMVAGIVEMLEEYGIPDGGGSDGTFSVADLAWRIFDRIEAA